MVNLDLKHGSASVWVWKDAMPHFVRKKVQARLCKLGGWGLSMYTMRLEAGHGSNYQTLGKEG